MISIQDKIMGEYRFYEMLLLATSRENIYNRSSEIEFKKIIVEDIRNMNFNQEITYTLYPLENLLDYITLIKKEQNLDTKAAINEIVRRVTEKKSGHHGNNAEHHGNA